MLNYQRVFFPCQHPRRFLHHGEDVLEGVLLPHSPPGGAHAEARGARVLGLARRLQHLVLKRFWGWGCFNAGYIYIYMTTDIYIYI